MGIFFARAVMFPLVLFCLVSPAILRADGTPDGTKDNNANAKPAAKPDAPAPGLTPREQWMLDRIEQLEKESPNSNRKDPGLKWPQQKQRPLFPQRRIPRPRLPAPLPLLTRLRFEVRLPELLVQSTLALHRQ